ARRDRRGRTRMTPPRKRSGDARPTKGGQGRPTRRGPQSRTSRSASGSTKRSQPTRMPAASATPDVDVHDPNGVRLQKLLAGAGVGSRRQCEQLIADGRVAVDGVVVTELGVRIDPRRQVVHVDGERVVLDESRVYLAFNKPRGVVTSMDDELGRADISDYL